MHREPEVPEARVPVEEYFDCTVRITSKEFAPIHSVQNGILHYASSTSRRKWMQICGKSALMRIARLTNSLAKGLKKNGDKSAVAMLKITRQLGCVSQDMEAAEVFIDFCGRAQTYRNQSDVFDSLKPWYVMLTFENQNPSLGMICPGDPHQRNPNAPQFEDRSQEETEWQERCAREAAWRLAQNILKIKGER